MLRLSTISAMVSLSVTVGCAETPEPEFRLVGLYDASAVTGLNPDFSEDYMWQPATGMETSCGPAKGPEGIRLFDAELIANRLAPTLAIVLEHAEPVDELLAQRREEAAAETELSEEDFERLWVSQQNQHTQRSAVTLNDVSVALGIGEGAFVLQPAVLPRHLAVRIEGDETNLRYQQLVRTQLEVELCMEHKVGRGWRAASGEQLRQAFLLDRPEGETRDRRYFGGQRDPVAPYLAAPDACLNVSESLGATATAVGGKGDGSTELVPSDIWGASLRDCSASQTQNQTVFQPSPMVPLSITAHGDRQAFPRLPQWTEMTVEVGTGERDEDILVTVLLEDDRLGASWDPIIMENQPLFEFTGELDEDGRKQGGMIDLMAAVPHQYPTVGPRYDPDRYVVLLVPNWQIVEGLRRIFGQTCFDSDNQCTCTVTGRDGSETCLNDYNESCDIGEEARMACDAQTPALDPMRSMFVGEMDGVGWVLENPELLFVQVNTLLNPVEEGSTANAFDSYRAWYNNNCSTLPWPMTCAPDELLFSCQDAGDEDDLSFIEGEITTSCLRDGEEVSDLECQLSSVLEDIDFDEQYVCGIANSQTLRQDNPLPTDLRCATEAGERRFRCAKQSLKPNLAVVTQGGFFGIQDWGYVAGQKVGRTPVVLPIDENADWVFAREAQRGRQHTLFLMMLGALLGFVGLGFRRLPDLWTRTPEERAYYWPGRQSRKEQQEVDPEGIEAAAEANEGGE